MKKEGNPFVAIPASMGGIFLGLAAMILVFAREQLGILVPIVWAFVVIVFFALLFAYKSSKKK